jgi:hypothetical protein
VVEMTKKQQLYYLLKAYYRNEYDIPTFCSAFEEVFYPDIPKKELTSFELSQFEAWAGVVVRFSSFEEDLKNYPGVYNTESDVKKAIEKAYSKLVKV